jgi:hypothetical protein
MKKQELIESNWRIITKSGNVELVWNVVPDSIPKHSIKEYESIGIRNMDWLQFHELCNMELAQMNEAIAKDYVIKSKKVGPVALNPYQKVNSSFFANHYLVRCHW